MRELFFRRLLGKFFVRTFISYLVIIVTVFLLIYVFLQGTIKHFYIENLKTQLSQVGHALESKAADLFEEKNLTGMDRWAKEVGKGVDIRITIIAPDGTVIADSQKDPLEMENHGHRPEILQALKGKAPDATRFSTTMGEQMLYLALPVEKNGDTRFIIRLSLYLKHIKQLVQELRWKFSAVLLVLFLLALLSAWYFSRGISKPVRQIAEATRAFAAGNFDVKIFLKKKDELAEVAESFNNMVLEQKNLFNKLSQNRAELQAIISSMKEGLLVLDPQGKITLCNDSFREITGKTELLGSAYWEVLRIPDFEAFVKRALQSGESFYQEVELDNKIYLLGFNPMKNKERLVIVFRDISGFKQLEQIKRDFVVNLTHELKTPLTAVKGFIETLEEEENLRNSQYVEIIKRHTDRMNQIVSNLLILSELEDSKRELVFEPVNLEEMVTYILKIYRDKIREKNLDLAVDIQENLPMVMAEKFKMEQMFINLVDNAYKYTDKGKISLIIEKTGNEKNIKIQVKNTGLIIPKKSLPRVFERFYVVDKSRSRKLGGTGLGLSIVKHVVLLHKGEISVESVEGEGTVFTICLPLK